MKKVNIIQVQINEQQTYIWLAYLRGVAIGHVFLTVELANKIKFHNAWVSEKYRKNGIYSMLWNKRWDFAKKNFHGYTVYAWCKPNSVGVFETHGFSIGESAIYVEKTID